jgi:hypothetical protein
VPGAFALGARRIGFFRTDSCAGGSLLSGAVESTGPPLAYLSLDDILARMAEADGEQHQALKQYSAVRRYTLRNQRMSKTAEIIVRVEYRKDDGKTFEILSSEGAQGISSRILHRLLENEAEASKKDLGDERKVSSQNYNFQLLGIESRGGRPCYVLTLRPKVKSKYLLSGIAWVNAHDFAIERIEGRPTASLSFWVGKPFIALDFEKVGDFWLVSRNHSHADGKLLGATDLTIDCSQYEVQATIQSKKEGNSPTIATVNTLLESR